MILMIIIVILVVIVITTSYTIIGGTLGIFRLRGMIMSIIY